MIEVSVSFWFGAISGVVFTLIVNFWVVHPYARRPLARRITRDRE